MRTRRNIFLYVSTNQKTTTNVNKQKDVLYRLKQFAETDLEAAKRALADDASEYDIRIALFLAKTIGIE